MDFETMADDELNALADGATRERERRKTLAMLPGQIAAIVASFRSAGGDVDALILGLMNGGVDDTAEY